MIKNTIKLLLAIVLFASCNQYEKSPSGLAYKITKGNGKEKLKHGQAIKLNIEYKLPVKDSVLSSSFEHIPVYFVLDTAHLGKYNFTELLTSVSEGDKIEFRLSIDTLKKMGMVEYNTIFHKGDFIAGKVDIVKTFPGQPEMMADYNKEVEAEKQKEIAALKAYTEKKGIKTQSTPGGVLVEIINPGEGAKADSVMQDSVLYRGAFLDSKKAFDSNMVNGVGQPYDVVVGSHGVIPGWEEGLKLLGKGAKARFFIPAMLAYGPQGSQPVIPPYANLSFDIQVTDVKVPAPKPAQPVMPGGQPQGQPAGQ